MLAISTMDRPQWDKEVLEGMGMEMVKMDTAFGHADIFIEKDEFYIPNEMFKFVAKKK